MRRLCMRRDSCSAAGDRLRRQRNTCGSTWRIRDLPRENRTIDPVWPLWDSDSGPDAGFCEPLKLVLVQV